MRIKALVLAILLLAVSLPALGEAAPEFTVGVDVSELAAQEAAGAIYLDTSGAPADALAVLADCGVACVRLRVWNDPHDAEGRGYGAGNIDAAVAAGLSARAAALGMRTLVDFHYSDFWADPSRQLAPKAWQGMDAAEKAAALRDFTAESLEAVLDAGGDVAMVQIGNETNNGMAGEQDIQIVAELMAAGCGAVRAVAGRRGLSIATCVHLTDPQNLSRVTEYLDALDAAGVDYDAVGLSFYPYWHGGPDALDAAVRAIRERGKDAFVAETAWPFTDDDGDGWPNVVDGSVSPYPATEDGQAQAFWDVCKTAEAAGAAGAFYWGGVWTPTASDAWETFGTGWATRFAAAYDPDHVGDGTGGCAWDNQALFGFDGRPLAALTGLGRLSEWEVSVPIEEAAEPEGGEPDNLVVNPGFEDENRDMWQAESLTGDIPFDFQDFVNDAHTGTVAFHYWSAQDMDFNVWQTLDGLEPGAYAASLFSQGGDMKDAELTLWVEADGVRYEAAFMNTSWANWQHPVIEDIPVADGSLTVGSHIRCGAKGWGTLDDFSVVKTD